MKIRMGVENVFGLGVKWSINKNFDTIDRWVGVFIGPFVVKVISTWNDRRNK